MRKKAFVVSFDGIGNWIALTPVLKLLERPANGFSYCCAENPFFDSRRLMESAGFVALEALYPGHWRRFGREDWIDIAGFFSRHQITHVFHFRNEPAGSDDNVLAFSRDFFPDIELLTLRPYIYGAKRSLIVRTVLDALNAAGVNCQGYAPQWLTPALRRRPANVKRRIAFCIGASQSNKRWRESAWIELSQHILTASDYSIIILSGRSEGEAVEGFRLYQNVLQIDGRRVEFERGRSLDQAVNALEASAGIVSNDSYPTHLAGALGLPVVGVYLTTDSRIWGPDCPRFRAVQNPMILGCSNFKPESGNCHRYYQSCLNACLESPEVSPAVVWDVLSQLLMNAEPT